MYRFTHPDGTAKEWAYSDLGNEQAEIRWGPENQLRQRQIKPLREAWERALHKVRKGYVKVGSVMLDNGGSRVTPRRTTSVRKPAVDLATLLGPEEDGFYF
nr:hypothetical protein [Thiocapsa sp.]